MKFVRLVFQIAAVYFALAYTTEARAHRPSDAFLSLEVEESKISGQVDIALRDLEIAMGLDSNGDLKITWGELEDRQKEIYEYVADRIQLLSGNTVCGVVPLDLQTVPHTDGAYAAVLFTVPCRFEVNTDFRVRYDILFDIDSQHRGLLNLQSNVGSTTHVFTPQNRDFTFSAAARSPRDRLISFVGDGLIHIFRGYDHILFLVALLLPAALRASGSVQGTCRLATAQTKPPQRRRGRSQRSSPLPSFTRKRFSYTPRDSLGEISLETFKVISAFTIAHTLSLCLTSLNLFPPPPSRWVESLIALTILLTSLNNLFPVVSDTRWGVVFLFGLIHGIGYASVLIDLGLAGWNLAIPLVGFNLGVEAAQIIIISLFLPIAFVLRGEQAYYWGILVTGSSVTAILSIIWMIEQIARVSILGF